MTSPAATPPSFTLQERRATLLHFLALDEDMRGAMAARELLEPKAPADGSFQPPLAGKAWDPVESAFRAFFERLLQEENVLILDHVHAWTLDAESVGTVASVFDERARTIRDVTKSQWASRVGEPVSNMFQDSQKSSIVREAQSRSDGLDLSMTSACLWLGKDLRANARSEAARQAASAQAAAAAEASVRSGDAAGAMARQGRWTATFALVAALSSVVTALIYVGQLSVANDQLHATKAQILLQKCATDSIHRELVIDMPCPGGTAHAPSTPPAHAQSAPTAALLPAQ